MGKLLVEAKKYSAVTSSSWRLLSTKAQKLVQFQNQRNSKRSENAAPILDLKTNSFLLFSCLLQFFHHSESMKEITERKGGNILCTSASSCYIEIIYILHYAAGVSPKINMKRKLPQLAYVFLRERWREHVIIKLQQAKKCPLPPKQKQSQKFLFRIV